MKTARLLGSDRSLREALAPELRRCGYAIDLTADPALVVVLVGGPKDEEALVAIAGATCPVVAVITETDERVESCVSAKWHAQRAAGFARTTIVRCTVV